MSLKPVPNQPQESPPAELYDEWEAADTADLDDYADDLIGTTSLTANEVDDYIDDLSH